MTLLVLIAFGWILLLSLPKLRARKRRKAQREESDIEKYLNQNFLESTLHISRPVIESDPPFQGELDKARLHLLQRVFDLTETDCRALHFDGKYFHFAGSTFLPQQIESIVVVETGTIAIDGDRIPSRERWAIERATGGPDLRFNDNKSWCLSKRTRLTISAQGFVIPHALYEMPDDGEWRETHDGTRLCLKAARLVMAAKEFPLKEIFESYLPFYNELQSVETQLLIVSNRQASVNDALASLEQMARTTRGLSASDRRNKRLLTVDLNRILNEARELERRRVFVGRRVMQVGTQLSADLMSLEANARTQQILGAIG